MVWLMLSALRHMNMLFAERRTKLKLSNCLRSSICEAAVCQLAVISSVPLYVSVSPTNTSENHSSDRRDLPFKESDQPLKDVLAVEKMSLGCCENVPWHILAYAKIARIIISICKVVKFWYVLTFVTWPSDMKILSFKKFSLCPSANGEGKGAKQTQVVKH